MIDRIQRQIAKNQQFIYHLGSSYALIGLNMATMFLLTPALLHGLGNENYGIWIILFNIVNYFNLSSFGFGQTFTLDLIKKKDKPKEVNKLVNTYLFSLFIFAAATAPIFLLLQFNLHWFKLSPDNIPMASKAFWIIYIVFFTNFLGQLPYNILFANNRLSLRNGLEMGRVALSFVLSYWVLNHDGTVLQLSIVTLAVGLTYNLALFIASKQVLDFEIKYDHYSKKLFRKFLKPSFHYFLLGLAMQVILFSDGIMVSTLFNAALVPIYSLALRIPDVSMRFIFKIADVKIPKVTSLYDGKDWYKLWLLHNRLFWLTMASAGCVCIILLTFGPWIMNTWIRNFEVNYSLLLIFSLNMFAQCLLHVPAIFLQSLGMHERASILAMFGAGVTIGLAWFLSGPLGLMGIALATTSVQFVVGILVVPQFYTFMKKKMELTGYSLSLFSLK